MTTHLKSTTFDFLQFLKIKEKPKTKPNQQEEIPDEIYFQICSFLTPKEIISTLCSTNQHLYKLCSQDFIWKSFTEKYSCYLPNTKPKDFQCSSYKQLFMMKTWKLSKLKSKGLKVSKDFKSVSNPVKTSFQSEIRLIASENSISSGRCLIRVRFDERIYGCFVGVVCKLNLDLALKSEKLNLYNHIKYMRDGSIGGIQKIYNEQIDRVRDVIGQQSKHRVYFCLEKDDVLDVYLDMDKAEIKFVVNDKSDCMITVSNIREMQLGSPVHLVLGLPFSQKFTILNNFKTELNETLGDVRITQSIAKTK
jgi:hypothetical protein